MVAHFQGAVLFLTE